MRPSVISVVVVPLLIFATGVGAQEVELPEYTDQQRWERLALLAVGWQAAAVALGESAGLSPEEVGERIGDFFATSWLGGTEASQFLTGIHRNFMSMPGAEVTVVSNTPTSVTARFNRPGDAFMDPGDRKMGVKAEAIDEMFRTIDTRIAEWVGIGLEHRRDGDHHVYTLETEYGPIRAGDDIRWARNSFLSWLTSLQMMSMRMEDGASASEIGAANAELYAPSWGAQTPWQLFRGMAWNGMSDPDADCEVLSASPTEVRARCDQHYRQVVEQNESRFGVTVNDVFESNRAFAEGVAEYLGLSWSEELRDGSRWITVTAG